MIIDMREIISDQDHVRGLSYPWMRTELVWALNDTTRSIRTLWTDILQQATS